MRKTFKLILMSFMLLLVGCTTEVAKLPTLDKGHNLASDRGLIVVKLDNLDYLDITKIEPALAAGQKQTLKQYRILKPNRLMAYSYIQSLYTIEPGTYYISYIAIDSPQGVYYSDAPGLSADGKIAYGAFEIKPGDVLYIGDIECQWKNTNTVRKLVLQNKLKFVKTDLASSGHEDLAEKIIVANFLPKGSNIK